MVTRIATVFFAILWSFSVLSAENPESSAATTDNTARQAVDSKLRDVAKNLTGTYRWSFPVGYDTLTIQWASTVDGQIIGGGRYRSSLNPQYPQGWPFLATVDSGDLTLVVIESQLDKNHVLRLRFSGGSRLTGTSIGGSDADFRKVAK